MAKSKSLSSYPKEYLQILQANLGGERLVIEFQTKREAQAFRFNYYGFRGALDAEGHPDAREAKSISIRLEEETRIVMERGGGGSDAIAQALAKLHLTPTPTLTPTLPTDEEIALEHDETDGQLNTSADEQAGLIKAFFSPDTDPEDLPEAR